MARASPVLRKPQRRCGFRILAFAARSIGAGARCADGDRRAAHGLRAFSPVRGGAMDGGGATP